MESGGKKVYPSDDLLADLKLGLAESNWAKCLTPAEVEKRAEELFQDLIRWQIADFKLQPPVPVPFPNGQRVPLLQYRFGSVPFGIDNARDPKNIKKQISEMGGTGIDVENILYLAQVCSIGRRCIPEIWFNDEEFVQCIRTPTMHSTTLNEVWWLARWKGLVPISVRREVKLVEPKGKSVDWQFQVEPAFTINLEVKNLFMSYADQIYKKKPLFYPATRLNGSPNKDDPTMKFRPSGTNEINVLGIRWHDQISPELENQAQQLLDRSDAIDFIGFWSLADRCRGCWHWLFPRFREIAFKRKIMAEILDAPTDEDTCLIAAIQHPRPWSDVPEEAKRVGIDPEGDS